MEKNKVTVKEILDIISKLPKTYSEDDVFAVIETKLGKKKMNVSSEDFKNYIAKIVFDEYNIYPSNMAINNAINYTRTTRFDHINDNAKYRINYDKNHIFYDLGNEKLQYVEITKSGWSVKNEANNYFITSPFAIEQSTPEYGNIQLLRKYTNLCDNDFLLFVIYLVTCLKRDISHPILHFVGEKGTCKSTLSEIIKRLIDPSTQNLGEFSHKLEDFQLRLSSEYLVVADNLEKLNSQESNMLCRVSTGGHITKRKLYTDSEQIMYKYQAIVVMTSISPLAKKDDLIDRLLAIRPLKVSSDERIPIDCFWNEFEKDKPLILGALFTILAKSIKIYPYVELEHHIRLADFHQFGYAVATVLGEGKRFNRLLIDNKQKYLLSAQEGNSIYKLILAFMDTVENDSWSGRTQKLLNELSYLVDDNDELSDSMLPNSVESLGRFLNFKRDIFLSTFGIKIESYRDTNNYSCVRLERVSYDNDIKTYDDINCIERTPIFRLPIISGRGKSLNKK